MGQQAASCCAELHGATTQQSVAVHSAVEDAEPMETFDLDENAPEKADRPALPCQAGLAGAAVVSPQFSVSGSLTKLLSKDSRLAGGSQLEVDEDIIRAVSLSTTLRSFGRAWRVNPQRLSPSELNRLWDASKETDSIDIFLSHTWSTPGHQKYLSLLLSSYWHYAMGGWSIAATSVGLLYAANLLPSLPFQVSLPQGPVVNMAPWVHVVSPWIALCGLMCAPYISSSFSSTTRCFLDVVCVNQADELQQERGIYGIGGFLAVSRELRILWSPPYLSRLWCVFEIAAFRKANPLGKLVFQPLFIERDILVVWLCMYLFVSALFFVIASGVRDGNTPFAFFFSSCCLGLLPAVHYVRKGYREQEQISQSLSEFDVSALQCFSDFDKRFIHSAVMQWYGSLDEFNVFVRGPLKEEILQTMLLSRVPLHLIIVAMSPVVGIQLDALVGILTAGFSSDYWGQWLFGQTLTLDMLTACELKCFFWLSKRFAKPRFSHRGMDFGQTILVVILFACCLLPLVAVGRAYRGSLMEATLVSLAACAVFCATFISMPCLKALGKAS
ncbi:unnamed protein product [Symbiodinium sp. CCMP2592]|nr:unnamed protein product [Symbiodinium sp. CCMP2592]